jgi:very-short-patch-repair endonuclease
VWHDRRANRHVAGPGDRIADPTRRGIWRSASAPPTALTGPWSAVLATGAVLSHSSAAAVHGIRAQPTTKVHVTVPDLSRVRVPRNVRVHRVPLLPHDIEERAGLTVTTLRRTVFDCLRSDALKDGRTLLDRALQRQWLAVSDIDRELTMALGRWGNAKLRQLRDECSMGDAESERRLHRLLRSAGIRGWASNAAVDVGFATLHFDVVFRGIKLIVEVDGWATHSDVERFRTDRTRQNAAVLAGWTVLRFTWHDVVDRPDYVAITVTGTIAGLS